MRMQHRYGATLHVITGVLCLVLLALLFVPYALKLVRQQQNKSLELRAECSSVDSCDSSMSSKKKRPGKVEKALRSAHGYLGKVFLIVVVIHALVAFKGFTLVSVLGFICFALALLLFITYLRRKHLGKKWLAMHRHLAFGMLALVIVHVFVQL